MKKITTLLMAAIMTICSFGTTVMAAETDNVMMVQPETMKLVDVEIDEDGNRTEVYEMEIPVEEQGEGAVAFALDQSFNMTGSHRGGDRTYSGSRLQYAVTVTGSNGSAVDATVSVQLHDYNHGYALSNANVRADGSTTVVPNVSITPNRVYYFTYAQTSGTIRALTVRMRITDYN